jgi:hypothetical protein
VAGGHGAAAGGQLPPLASLPPSELAWLEEVTTTDRFFKVCGCDDGERTAGCIVLASVDHCIGRLFRDTDALQS